MRRKSARKLNLIALLASVALVAAACGGDDSAGAATEAQDDGGTTADATEDEAMEDEAEDEAIEDEAMEDEMEDGGTVTITIENIASFPVSDSGVFNTPVDASEPGPVLPGGAYEFSTYAQPGDRLSFATMFVQSNDWFFAPAPEGIELFDSAGDPISGDVTDMVFTYDSGTEADQPVGEGADQAPRQAGPDTGAEDPDANIRSVDRSAGDYVAVTVTPGDDGQFDVRVANTSEMATVPSPIAPGVYAVHTADAALFEIGRPDAGDGLEALAEDGNPASLADHLADVTGTSTPLAPGVWAAHEESASLFDLGSPDAGLGLEALAEDGDPSGLAAALADVDGVSHSEVFSTPDGASGPGPLLPGESYSFQVPIVEGERLSFATMFVQSNDWIFATPEEGLELTSLDGDITDELEIVDLGTEIDQRPGFGADQAPRQAGPATGADDPDNTVRILDARDVERYIAVTVSSS